MSKKITYSFGSKKEELKFVLCIDVSSEDEDYLKEYWKAFYERPCDYINDDMLDLIIDDLWGVNTDSIEYKNVCRVLERELQLFEYNWVFTMYNGFVYEPDKYSNLKDIILEGIDALHKIPSEKIETKNQEGLKMFGTTVYTLFEKWKKDSWDTMIWGKLVGNGIFAYAKGGVGNEVGAKAINKFPIDIAQDDVDNNRHGFVAFDIMGDALIIPYSEISALTQSKVLDLIESYCGGKYLKSTDLTNDESPDDYRLLANLYTAFAPGPNGTKIPTLWAVDDADLRNRVTEIPLVINNLTCSSEDVVDVYDDITDKFPAIDLQAENGEAMRYIPVVVKTAKPYAYIYNRNHVAHNGTVASVMLSYCISCNYLADIMDSNVMFSNSNYDGFLNGTQDFWYMSNDASMNTEQMQEKVQEKETAKQQSNFNFSDNPMIAAAQRVSHGDE
mgnify:CR=1 FL=1